jgi:4-amino-4-deoxy-L-arabinose transferase-like glycosyltransferase
MMSLQSPFHWISLLLRYILLLVAGLYLAAFLGAALSRIYYPFELEWMEGASFDTVQRVLEGKPIYTHPSPAYVPPIYGPVYFYACAAVAAVLGGDGFFSLRLVSLLAAVGTLLLIYLLVLHETRDRFAAFIAAGLFAATFHLSGGFLDLARVDTLFLCLSVASVYLLRTQLSSAGWIACGVTLALAYLTKQTAFILVVALALVCLTLYWRRLPFLVLPFVLIVGATLLLFQASSDGWYAYFVLSLGGQGQGERSMLLDFWRVDLVPLGIAFLVMLWMLYSLLRQGQLADFRFYLPITIAMICAAWFGRLRSGGWVNVLLPAFAMLSIMLGMGLHRLLSVSHSRKAVLQTATCVLCLIQFGVLAYDPADHLPSAADRAAGDKLVSQLAAAEGEVMVFAHGHLAHAAGKPGYDLGWAMNILSGENMALREQYIAEINQVLTSGQVEMLVVDNYVFLHEPFQAIIDQYYNAEWIDYEGDEFVPVTGMDTRPTLIYRLRASGRASE